MLKYIVFLKSIGPGLIHVARAQHSWPFYVDIRCMVSRGIGSITYVFEVLALFIQDTGKQIL